MAGRDENAAWPVMVSAVLLAGAVAAAMSAAMLRFGDDGAPAIASVRLGEIAAGYAVTAAGAGSSEEETAADARRWAAALETALGRVAERHRVVLLPARAVAAGAPDLTVEVEAALAALLAGGPADGPGPSPGARP